MPNNEILPGDDDKTKELIARNFRIGIIVMHFYFSIVLVSK